MASRASKARKSAAAKKPETKKSAKATRAKAKARPEEHATARSVPWKKKTAKKKTTKKVLAKKPAPKRATAKKPTAKKPAPKKASAKKPTAKKVLAKKPAPTKRAATATVDVAALARPSERSMAACTLLPREERPLDDVERSAMGKVAAKARALLGAGGTPEEIVLRIAAFVDDVRSAAAPPPRDRDELFGLGVLWGEQLRAQVGWLWVHLSYEEGLSSFALVPDDRAFAVFPIDRVLELLGPEASKTRANTLAGRFAAIRDEQLPHRKPNGYLVIG